MIYLANIGAFEATADAIREKLGTDLLLVWDIDTGFADDVKQIETGKYESIPLCALDKRNAIRVPDAFVALDGTTATINSTSDGVSFYYFDLSSIDIPDNVSNIIIITSSDDLPAKQLRYGFFDSVDIGSVGKGEFPTENIFSTGSKVFRIVYNAIPSIIDVHKHYLALYGGSDVLKTRDYWAVLLF